jgi:histone H3/H4
MKRRRKKRMEDIDLLIKSKIKSAVPELSVSSDVPEELNKKVLEILDAAAKRAKLNGRRTLQAKDL